jgi:hypothetical protein
VAGMFLNAASDAVRFAVNDVAGVSTRLPDAPSHLSSHLPAASL